MLPALPEQGVPREGAGRSPTGALAVDREKSGESADAAELVGCFLAGVGVSAFGDWLTTFALAVVLYRETGSYAATAGYFLVRVAPRPLGAWLGGPLGDLVSPRLGILAAALTQGAITAALAIPLSLDHALWSVYVLAGLSQLVGGSWQPLTAAVMAKLATRRGPAHPQPRVHRPERWGDAGLPGDRGPAAALARGGAPGPCRRGHVRRRRDPLRLAPGHARGRRAPAHPPRCRARRLQRRPPSAHLRVIAVGAFSSTVAITALQAALPALASQGLATRRTPASSTLRWDWGASRAR